MRVSRPCPSCGFINSHESDRCLKCGAVLAERDMSAWFEKEPGHATGKTANAIERLLAVLRRRSERLAEQAAPMAEAEYRHRSPWLAAFLALVVPGAGAWVRGKKGRAVLIATITLSLTAVALITFRQPYNNWLLGIWGLWILATMNDAITLTIRANGQLWTQRRILATYAYLLMAAGSFAMTTQFLLTPVLRFVSIREDVLEPSFSRGDRVLVWKGAYWFGQPARGDVLFYDPPSLYFEPSVPQEGFPLGHDAYLINEKNTFERVNALEGDVLERKGEGPVLLNGNPLPEAWNALSPGGLPTLFRIEVPKGKLGVMYSHMAKETLGQIGSIGGISPRPGDPGFILKDWDKACVIDPDVIIGRVIAVYHPPQHRRWIHRSPDDSGASR